MIVGTHHATRPLAEIEIMNRDEAVAVFGIGFVQDLESME